MVQQSKARPFTEGGTKDSCPLYRYEPLPHVSPSPVSGWIGRQRLSTNAVISYQNIGGFCFIYFFLILNLFFVRSKWSNMAVSAAIPMQGLLNVIIYSKKFKAIRCLFGKYVFCFFPIRPEFCGLSWNRSAVVIDSPALGQSKIRPWSMRMLHGSAWRS